MAPSPAWPQLTVLLALSITLKCSTVLALQSASESTVMWFNTSNIIPIGNGRLGAMMLGQAPVESIVLNEDRIWSGHANDPNPKGCAAILSTVRDHIWKDELYEAQHLVGNNCMASPLKQQVYQTAGNISLTTDHTGLISNFNHTLDLATAVSTSTYAHGGIQYTRTAFASHPDDVIVIRLTANVSQAITFNVTFQTPMTSPRYAVSGSSISVSATGTTMYTLPGSINYNATAQVTALGGVISTQGGNTPRVSVKRANEAMIVIGIDTNYVRYDDITGNASARVHRTLEAVRSKTYDALLRAHIADHSALFGRVQLTLGAPTAASYLPTNTRRLLRSGPDPNIFALYAQFGRYMAIASSRKTEPSNLQGLWNKEITPNWGSKYTININQQMSSWPAEPLNLPETLDPLWRLLQDLAERGAATAKDIYNIGRGWVAHHNSGIWRDSAPIDSAFHGFWPVAPAWLAEHLWEHYAFNPDPADSFVRDVAYPLMKGLTEFFLDFLVEDPFDGYLVTNPSQSPEKGIADYNGENVALTYGSTVDNAVLRDLFNHTVEFAKILKTDDAFAANVTKTMERLMPFRVGSMGHLQEWAVDYAPGGVFTHISHLYPLFPSAQIDPRLNSTLAQAAARSLAIRGDAGNGWPTAWRANCFARLLDSEKALYYMNRLLSVFSYENLWSRNSIFQIDGNFGGTMAVAEMVLQSHNGEIHLLPAVPASWPEGNFTGLRARGGFQVDIQWSGNRLVSAKLTSTVEVFARVRCQGKAINLTFDKGQTRLLSANDFV